MTTVSMTPEAQRAVNLFTSETENPEDIRVPTAGELVNDNKGWACDLHSSKKDDVTQSWDLKFKAFTRFRLDQIADKTYKEFIIPRSVDPEKPPTPWYSRSQDKASDNQLLVKYMPFAKRLLIMHVSPTNDPANPEFPAFPDRGGFMLRGYSECVSQ
ncbi:MAG: hypothetical protein HQM16_11740 [Deltaproteobacteria bacterium]|nr:hypothetical protein [Deltaproteobacteria bacterium]